MQQAVRLLPKGERVVEYVYRRNVVSLDCVVFDQPAYHEIRAPFQHSHLVNVVVQRSVVLHLTPLILEKNRVPMKPFFLFLDGF